MPPRLAKQTSAGLRIRLLVIILALIAPIAVFVVAGFVQVKATRIRLAQERAYEFAKAGAARFQDTIDDVEAVFGILSRVTDVTSGTPDACGTFLKETARAHPWARSLSLLDENQKITCSTNPQALAFDASNRPWFRAARAKGGFDFSGFLVSPVNELPTTFAVLFFRDVLTDKPRALLASLDLAWFDRLAEAVGERQNVLVLLADSEGAILARYPTSPVQSGARLPGSIVGGLSDPKESRFSAIGPDGRERLFGSVPLAQGRGHVVVGFDRAETLGLVGTYLKIAVLVFGAVLLLGGFVFWVVGDRIFVRPIEELSGLLRTTLDTMDQGLIAIDRHGKSTVMNLRALDLLGLPHEFAVTHPHVDEILEFQRRIGEFSTEKQYESVVKHFHDRRHSSYERERPNGTVLEVRTVSPEGGGSVRTYTDVTARRAIEAELRREKERAEAAARTAADFLANMSHELRTPLTAIIGVADVLLNEPQSQADRRRFMEMQLDAARTLLGSINDILDFSKIEAGQLGLETVPLSVSEIAHGCMRLISDQAERKGLKVTIAIGNNVPDRVSGDPTRIRQILLNLLANAVKFTPSGLVALAIDRVAGPGHAIRFSVTDTGIGIKPERIGALFQRFVQADGSTTREFGGTGLGLAICERLVAAMGGNIEVQSELGRGTAFSFTIEMPLSAEAPPEPLPLLRSDRPSYRLLLAEDNALSREIIKTMLEQAGHQVQTVNDGVEAVQTAARYSFDAILMDVQMPEMDGYAATRAIRNASRNAPNLPIIALTANALSDESERCMQAGMNAYLPKPVNLSALLSMIDRHVRKDRPPAQASTVGSTAQSVLQTLNETTLDQLRCTIGNSAATNLLKLFVVEAERRFLSAPPSLDDERTSMAKEAHAFGLSAGLFGFEELADACAALELACDQDRAIDKWLDRCRRERDNAVGIISDSCRIARVGA